MDRIKSVCGKIKTIDGRLMEKAQARLDSLTKPLGSLGRLEELAKQVVGITGKARPSLKDKVIFTLAADHGVTEEGVSAYPKEVTAQMVYNFMRGGAGINVLARHAGARVVVADMGVAEKIKSPPDAEGFVEKKIGLGTKNFAKGPAMSAAEAAGAVEAGIDIFEKELKKGVDIVGTGEMGIGNTTAASAITAVFTKRSVGEITGRGTGIDDGSLKRKISVIKKALRVNKPDAGNAMDVLAKVGGFEIGGLAGIILGAASKGVPVVVDGFISASAALLAYHIEPKTKEYMIASHNSVEIGHNAILEHIGLKPILDLNLRLGEGTGAALGIIVVEAGLKIFNEMATFEDAGVSKKEAR